jgi:hypothetical protein
MRLRCGHGSPEFDRGRCRKQACAYKLYGSQAEEHVCRHWHNPHILE